MGSPSRNVQYHPPRLSEDRLNLAQPHSPSLPTHCTAPGNRECAPAVAVTVAIAIAGAVVGSGVGTVAVSRGIRAVERVVEPRIEPERPVAMATGEQGTGRDHAADRAGARSRRTRHGARRGAIGGAAILGLGRGRSCRRAAHQHSDRQNGADGRSRVTHEQSSWQGMGITIQRPIRKGRAALAPPNPSQRTGEACHQAATGASAAEDMRVA